MSSVSIRVENLSKQYQIGRAKRRHDTLRDQLVAGFSSLVSRNGRSRKESRAGGTPSTDTIWALKDVSFEVKEGEVIGIIGRNGAGKSTLLKILSRIVEPTKGRAEIYGRVGSLLEVGTGFQPELTGRENIYLNGAILGMRKAEIEKNFDEIVAFSEIEKFIDTPVKRYSSGMYVRLAFAVAAHLEPEILIVDEVLAVGDTAFQKKCLSKMNEVSRTGRTVLFVSHNMGAVKALCTRAMLIDSGAIACDQSVDEVVNAYLNQGTEMSKTGVIPDNANRIGTGHARIRCVKLSDLSGKELSQLYFGQPFRVTFTFEALKDVRDAVIELGISSEDATRVTYSSNIDGGASPGVFAKGSHTVHVDIDVTLLPRKYSFIVAIHHFNGTTIDWIERALDFTVLNVSANGGDYYRWTPVRGYVRPPARWSIGANHYSSPERLPETIIGGEE
jgi:lipopolysaccharide transport system ATP-binding protein